MPDEAVLKKTEVQVVASIRATIPSYSEVGRLFGEIFAYLGRQGVAPAGPPMAIYYDAEYKEQDVDVEAAVPVGRKLTGNERISIYELKPVSQMATIIHKGDYGAIGQAYQALMKWIEGSGYRITGHNREVYLEGPGQGKNPSSYVTEVQFPVEKI